MNRDHRTRFLLTLFVFVGLVALAAGAVVFLVLGGPHLKSITGRIGCASSPVVVNGTSINTVAQLSMATGHQYTNDELSSLGITPCGTTLCATTCAAVHP